MKDSQYLDFVLSEQLPKTKVWSVISKQHGDQLGTIKYFGRWRQYTFFPNTGTVWNTQCLQDVTSFLNKENYARQGIKYTPIKPSVSQEPDHISMGGAAYPLEEWLFDFANKPRKKVDKLSDDKLLEYIKTKEYRCCFCADLKRDVLEKGVEAIDKHDGMICGGVEEMYQLRGRY